MRKLRTAVAENDYAPHRKVTYTCESKEESAEEGERLGEGGGRRGDYHTSGDAVTSVPQIAGSQR